MNALNDFLNNLAGSEGGRRFLINFLEGLTSGHISGELAVKLIGKIASGCAGLTEWEALFREIASVVYAAPDDYQFQGPKTRAPSAYWMTVKSAGDILSFMVATSGLSNEELSERLGVADVESPSANLNDEYYRRIAEVLNDRSSAIGFMMARRFEDPADKAVLRPCPTWYSCWCRFPDRDTFGLAPAPERAGRVRDWLGLGHYGADDPLFLIRARVPFNAEALRAHRPTVLDGFDNPLYKHRATEEDNLELIGSAVDIELLAGAVVGARLDGGPEVVSRGSQFDPSVFLCQYLGKPPGLPGDLTGPALDEILLEPDMTIARVVEKLVALLATAARGVA